MGFEVVILRQNTSAEQLLLQGLNKVQQVLRLTATDVIYGVGSQRLVPKGRLVFYGQLPYYTTSINVSGLPGSNISLQYITVTRFSLSERLMMLWV